MEIPFGSIAAEVESGELRIRLEKELTEQFQKMADDGETLPPSSYMAARIAEVLDRQSEQELTRETSFALYQEVALACENALRNVMGEDEEGKPRRWK
jgi:hypothetical protein